MAFQSETEGCVVKRTKRISRRFYAVRLTAVKMSGVGALGPMSEDRESPD